MSRKLLTGDYEKICLKTQETLNSNENNNSIIIFLFFFMGIMLALLINVVKQEIEYERFHYNRDNHNTKVTVHSMV
jgi:hypothetical protein